MRGVVGQTIRADAWADWARRIGLAASGWGRSAPFGRVGLWLVAVLLLVVLAPAGSAWGQAAGGAQAGAGAAMANDAAGAVPDLIPTLAPPGQGMQLPDLTRRENFSPALQIIVLLTVLSLAPSILLMMTCFTRMIIVLALLRQALGTQQLPPNQVLVGLALFMTFVVMAPTVNEINTNALQPYLNGQLDQRTALTKALIPVRQFMQRQIEAAGNEADVDLFMDFGRLPRAQTWEEVPTLKLIPAFILSELKTAFLIGFKIYLPFLVIDMVISSVLIAMGMMMLPPILISLPFKLLLFVLVDGWRLIAGGLMGGFVT